MTHIGIDIEQFVRDPYGTGIQRVLQYLALEWPEDGPTAQFVAPHRNGHLLLTPEQAAPILGIPFAGRPGDLRENVQSALAAVDGPVVPAGTLLSLFHAWLLPEVTYQPEVLARARMFAACMPLVMIGYDALPMTHPENYRFPPGTAARVSEYFRLLATADAVVCISDFARASLWDRLRRDRRRTTTVAHPGGDHVTYENPRTYPTNQPMILRVGTLEARKQPRETVDACRVMAAHGWQGRMVLIGRPSASDPTINAAVDAAARAGIGLSWIQDASDEDVHRHVRDASLFLSLGTEGYGIPVLEALGRGVPVVYDGIQPAAELMDAKGALRIDARSSESLARSLIDACARRDALASTIDTSAIPTWRDFVRGVVAVL